MGKISAELIGDSIVVTRYETDGFIIPDKISQEKNIVSIITNNIDTDVKEENSLEQDEIAVNRGKFLYTLLSLGDEGCKGRYLEYCKGLYSEMDMKRGITWSEVAYLLYYVGGLDRKLRWSDIKPKEGYKVCVLQEISDGRKVVNEKLAMYKNRLDMEYYIKAIVSGKRYIPLPLYCSFIELMNNDGLEIELKEDMMFKKISEYDLSVMF